MGRRPGARRPPARIGRILATPRAGYASPVKFVFREPWAGQEVLGQSCYLPLEASLPL